MIASLDIHPSVLLAAGPAKVTGCGPQQGDESFDVLQCERLVCDIALFGRGAHIDVCVPSPIMSSYPCATALKICSLCLLITCCASNVCFVVRSCSGIDCSGFSGSVSCGAVVMLRCSNWSAWSSVMSLKSRFTAAAGLCIARRSRTSTRA
jgi:hypothetical protein